MRRLSGLAYFYIIIILFILVMIVSAVPMRFLSSKLVPLAVAIPLFFVAVTGFTREVMRHREPEARTETAIDEDEGGITLEQPVLKSYLPITAWILGFAVGIYIIGLVVAMPAFILAYMKTHGIGWLTGIITATITTVFIWVVFELVLYIELYRGLLLDAFGM